MSPDDIHERFYRDFPLGEFAHIDMPDEYDPIKVEAMVDFEFASITSRASRSHRTWFVPARYYLDFIRVIDSGLVSRFNGGGE